MNSFLHAFEPVELRDGHSPEFPLDLPGRRAGSKVVVAHGPGVAPTASTPEDDATIPLHAYSEESDLEGTAARTILTAGLERGLIVYDPGEESGVFSLGLLVRLGQLLRRSGGGKVTDLFLRRGAKLRASAFEMFSYALMVHLVEDEPWGLLVSGATSDLPPGKTELVIALDRQVRDAMVLAERGDEVGLAVLDVNKVLLGSY